jgi:hypothetical protein
LTIALRALDLEILDESRSDLMTLHNNPVSAALITVLNIFWVLSPQTPTMRANNFPVVCDLKIFANIQLFKSDSDL